MAVTLVEGDLPAELARTLRYAGRVAVDTETSGLDWAGDQLQMCQLFTPETGPVLLREVDRFPSELARVLSEPTVLKVLHFAPFDLRFLEARWGVRVTPVACTKAASRLLDPGLPSAAHSLQSLMRRYLDISITKGPVRTSDWGAAMLSDEQLAYAASDVAYLLDLHETLSKLLDVKELSTIFSQVCAYVPVDAHLAVVGVPNPLTY